MNIIEMAKQAGLEFDDSCTLEPTTIWYITTDDLERFSALVRAAALDEAAEYLKSVHQTRLVKFADAIQQLKETK